MTVTSIRLVSKYGLNLVDQEGKENPQALAGMFAEGFAGRIVQPVPEDDNIVAVGGLIRVAQCVAMEEGNVVGYYLPLNLNQAQSKALVLKKGFQGLKRILFLIIIKCRSIFR